MDLRTSADGISAGSHEHELDRYLTPQEIAASLQVHENTIRRMFADIPGVLKLTTQRRRGRQPYTTLRIPRHVLDRILLERSK
jgi:hypothetical protein